MRLEIKSADRIGISQEILSVFSQHLWNLRAIEVATCFTYVHIEPDDVSLDKIRSSLDKVEGILQCREIELLPSERRENHLQTLLNRIPDPIIDIDEQGIILAINQAAKKLIGNKADKLEGRDITSYIELDHKALASDKAITTEINFAGTPYIADISPVIADAEAEAKVTGAVIVLRSMNTLGRQISLMQTRNDQGIENVIGQSAKMKLLIEQTLRFADLELPVLISGETGTGKELIARAIHNASSRAKAPFLAINCAALPEHLLESELFGYAGGAFTGAQKGGKPGLFELASGGTVFLDEIAEMSIYLQAKLLRFLQDFRYRRLGGTTELSANVRIISASHQNLVALSAKQLFREDLYYRLNVLSLELPALRDRKEDIALLTRHFIANAAAQVNQQVPDISEQAMAILQHYHWPGNIRQLQNVLFRLVALNTKAMIGQEDLADLLAQSSDQQAQAVKDYSDTRDWKSAQAAFEHGLLTQLYPLYPTTRKLAKRLNVSHNKIAMKLREHGLD
ncbi:sigma 54-interacting transcriptional regulator [Thalassomonas actiniarum]|uniref:HTH-type transcriptional regulatory protein TyrR n=1 Tax=Thalassomonas actiniarum TaxID=485447 RepID=A0AAF0C2K1_9GAMM|nr:sigma 54-interacting transcriptional regulator [Thalassomonas actiniarum]WDD97945.1 sigma 54-interacting transcriptional regulator [Thalassomonas actiniarum]